MSDFDELAAESMETFMESMGDVDAVEIVTVAGKKKFPAIVSDIVVEPVEETTGSLSQWIERDVCRASIQCPLDAISVNKRVIVYKHTTGDASTHNQQSFNVRSIDRIIGTNIDVTLWRESLTKVTARGIER